MKWTLARLAGVAALLLGLPAVLAYTYTGSRWATNSTTINIAIPGRNGKWAAALEAAAQAWNDKTLFHFDINQSYVEPCAGYTKTSSPSTGDAGDLRNGADFRLDVCGSKFDSGVLAITMKLMDEGRLGFNYMREADIVFNANMNWDVYTGPRRSGVYDFGRTALHELGHVIGLGHESANESIMAPNISDIDTLKTDDIAGVNALYGTGSVCLIKDLPINSVVRDSLAKNDCRMLNLYSVSSDDSYVDVYKIKLTTFTRVVIDMRSTQMDPVIVLTDGNLREIDINDDWQGSCTAHMDTTLAAGTYLVLANTYTNPRKCVGNVGSYSLSITDSVQPVLGDAGSTGTIAAPAALFTGGASSDGGKTYKTGFAATDAIDVDAAIVVDPAHVGLRGKVFVLAQVSNGLRVTLGPDGNFVAYNGNLADMTPLRTGPLSAREVVPVIKGLRGAALGLAGQSFVVYVGYSLDSLPGSVFYGAEPIRFSIAR